MPYGYMNQLPPRLPFKQRLLNNQYVNFFRKFDILLTIRALLFTAIAGIVIGFFVLFLFIERFIKFLRKFDALFVWSLMIIGSWALFIAIFYLIF
jgi:hypothetical protein